MRSIALAVALLSASVPALACVCSPPTSEADKRAIAARIARESVAVVDVEQVAPLDFDAMRGETYRVAKVHIGNAPEKFELARAFDRGPDGKVSMGMTSCDEIPPPGTRTTVVLYATELPGKFRFGGTCDHLFVNTAGSIALIRSQLPRIVERG